MTSEIPPESPAARAAHLLDEAAQRSRVTVRDRLRRTWSLAPAIAQTALAAGGAWLVAHNAIGHSKPFFAPISAIVVLGISYGRHARRAVELAAGVSLGILVADAIVAGIGTGPLTIALVVALAMATAILLGGEGLVVSQAATSASLVATLAATGHFTLARAVDAAVGGGVGVGVSLLLFPIDPARVARRAAQPLLDELAAVLAALAAALEDRDHDAAADVLIRSRELDGLMARFREAAGVGYEVARFAPLRRGRRPTLERYERAAAQLDNAQRNIRVLARGAIRALELGDNVPPEAIAALRELAAAVRAIAPSLDAPDRADRARERALRAAASATLALERTTNMSASVIVGQIRSIAVDLLRALGADREDAVAEVRAAASELDASA